MNHIVNSTRTFYNYAFNIFLSLVYVSKRITIMLDDAIHEKLRKLQAKMIQESGKSVSFSRMVNETLVQILRKK